MELKDLVKEMGFESENEFHKLVSGLKLRNSLEIAAFKAWQNLDGSKKGLLDLAERLHQKIG